MPSRPGGPGAWHARVVVIPKLSDPRWLWGVALAALLLLGGLLALPPTATPPVLHDSRLGLHLVLEMFAVVIGALVIVTSSHAFDDRRPAAGPIMAAGFTVVATCDLMHALTYEGMPDLISTSSTPQAIFFWLAGRTAEVTTMAIVAWGPRRRLPPLGTGAAGLLLAAGLVVIGTTRLDLFPTTFVPGRGVTPFKARYEYVLCASNLAVAALLLLRHAGHRHEGRRLLALSSFLMGVGELAFTQYTAPSDVQNVFGHLYKVAAYGLLFRVALIESIRTPYQALQLSEARLRESEARLHTLGRNLPLCVVFQLQEDGRGGRRRFVFVGDALERVVGLAAADARADAERLFTKVHAEDRAALHAAFEHSRERGAVLDIRLRLLRTDGALRRVHVVAAPQPLADGSRLWDGTLTDVTEQELADEARRRLESDLRQAQKMEALGTLASGIAHDFNSVIAAILGNARMARDDVAQRAWRGADHSLVEIERAAGRARSLARQILSFGRRQTPQRLLQPLQPAVADALDLLKATLPAQVQIVRHLQGESALVLADATQIAQVVINLCTNAWQAMGPAGGRVVVTVQDTALDRDAALALGLAAGRYACLSVHDDGPGIDEAMRRRIFEPFFTTKAPGQGTGLGLSVVQGIVTQHDGAVSVESAPGQGTTFRIFLPWQAPLAASADAPVVAAAASGARGRILCVDDDETVLLMVERLLVRRGHAVHAYRDPKLALEALQRQTAAYDVVVTDYNMPGLTGLELARAVAALDPLLPVLLVTAATEPLAPGVAPPVFEVVEKQHLLDELEVALDRALASRAEAGAVHG